MEDAHQENETESTNDIITNHHYAEIEPTASHPHLVVEAIQLWHNNNQRADWNEIESSGTAVTNIVKYLKGRSASLPETSLPTVARKTLRHTNSICLT